MSPEVAQAAAPPPPSAKTLAIASAVAALVAVAALLTAVLPAEYGLDPLGTGKAWGLLAIAQPEALEPVVVPAGAALAPVAAGTVAWYPGRYKVDSRTFVLGPYEYIEFKYHLAKDAVMLFSWTADGNLIQDFHGDPDGGPADATQSYDKQPRRQGDGSFTAPFSGIHGWFWENRGTTDVTVKLTTSGFYTSAHAFSYDGSRAAHQVQDNDAIPPSQQ